MIKKQIISFSMLSVYLIVLLHSIIPHHHHDIENIVYQHQCDQKHDSHENCEHHEHEINDNDSPSKNICVDHNSKDDCNNTCSFFVELFKEDVLNANFILPADFYFRTPQSEKIIHYSHFDNNFIETHFYCSNYLRGPPVSIA